MRRALIRLGLIVGSTAVAVLAFRLLRPEQELVRFHRIDPDAIGSSRGARPDAELSATVPDAWRYFMPREQAARFFGFGQGPSTYDPWTYARPRALLRQRIDWPEHPEGHWWLRTNSLGLREDGEITDPPADLRVLVAGDSHTHGVCSNPESFPNLLEERLGALHPGQQVEVLNAGAAGYAFHNYFGTLLRLRAFEPHVFVVTVYAGNDFSEAAVLHHHFKGEPLAEWGPEESLVRDEAVAQAPQAMAQCLNSVYTFERLAGEYELARAAAIQLCKEMDSVCRERGAQMIVCVLPAACDCEWSGSHAEIERARSRLGLAPDELDVLQRLSAQFLQDLEAAGITAVDMAPVFDRQPSPPFWRQDLHMNLDAHRLAAAALEPVVDAFLPD